MNNVKIGREYATKDISNIVGIAPSTVRRYSQALEKSGYSFNKNKKGFRLFRDENILVFNEMKRLSNDKSMPIEKIAEMIVYNQRQEIQPEATSIEIHKNIQADSGNSNDILSTDTPYNLLIEKLAKLDMLDDVAMELREVKATNKALMEQMKQQQELIEKILLEREKQLVGSLRLSMDTKQLQNQLDEIKESLLEVAVGQEKPFFSRLFSSHK